MITDKFYEDNKEMLNTWEKIRYDKSALSSSKMMLQYGKRVDICVLKLVQAAAHDTFHHLACGDFCEHWDLRAISSTETTCRLAIEWVVKFEIHISLVDKQLEWKFVIPDDSIELHQRLKWDYFKGMKSEIEMRSKVKAQRVFLAIFGDPSVENILNNIQSFLLGYFQNKAAYKNLPYSGMNTK